ncbi:MAG: hypothetical protein KAT77_04655 [Nanoarchaeota archaeon]|nr:hypothetical protein [Nanoarchaeota archaeon]
MARIKILKAVFCLTMSLEKFILEVLREFDVVHKKKLSKKDSCVEVDFQRKKIYLRKDQPGYGLDTFLLTGIARVYYRFYHRQEADMGDALDLAKKWYSEIYSDLKPED